MVQKGNILNYKHVISIAENHSRDTIYGCHIHRDMISIKLILWKQRKMLQQGVKDKNTQLRILRQLQECGCTSQSPHLTEVKQPSIRIKEDHFSKDSLLITQLFKNYIRNFCNDKSHKHSVKAKQNKKHHQATGGRSQKGKEET